MLHRNKSYLEGNPPGGILKNKNQLGRYLILVGVGSLMG